MQETVYQNVYNILKQNLYESHQDITALASSYFDAIRESIHVLDPFRHLLARAFNGVDLTSVNEEERKRSLLEKTFLNWNLSGDKVTSQSIKNKATVLQSEASKNNLSKRKKSFTWFGET